MLWYDKLCALTQTSNQYAEIREVKRLPDLTKGRIRGYSYRHFCVEYTRIRAPLSLLVNGVQTAGLTLPAIERAKRGIASR